MKKLLLTFLLALITTSSFAKEVVSSGEGAIYIVDGREVYFCNIHGCQKVEDDYREAEDSFPLQLMKEQNRRKEKINYKGK